MEGVPVWSLPEIPRKRAIHRMKPADILELSLRSEPFRSFLKANKLPKVKLDWKFDNEKCEIILENPSHWVSISFKENEDAKSPVSLSSRLPVFSSSRLRTSSESPAFYFKLDGDLEMKRVIRDGIKFTVTSCGDYQGKLKAMEVMSKHIAEIAHVTYGLQYGGIPPFDFSECFIFKTTKSFEHASIGNNYDSHVFPETQLRFLLEKLDIETLEVSRCTLKELAEDDFWFEDSGHEKLKNITFDQKHLLLSDCGWLKPNDLLNNSQVESINARFPYSEDQLEEFTELAEAWQRGTHFQDLKEMKLISRYHWPKGTEMAIERDNSLVIVRTGTNDEFPEFTGTIERFSDGELAEVKVYNSKFWRAALDRREPVAHFELTVLEWEDSDDE